MSRQQTPAKPKTMTDRTGPNAHDDVLLDREAIAMDTGESTVSPAMAPNGNAASKGGTIKRFVEDMPPPRLPRRRPGQAHGPGAGAVVFPAL